MEWTAERKRKMIETRKANAAAKLLREKEFNGKQAEGLKKVTKRKGFSASSEAKRLRTRRKNKKLREAGKLAPYKYGKYGSAVKQIIPLGPMNGESPFKGKKGGPIIRKQKETAVLNYGALAELVIELSKRL